MIEALRSFHIGASGEEQATSFVDAVYKKTLAWDSGKYDLAGNLAIGLAIGLGAWVVAFFVELLVWHVMTFNWRRLVCCGRVRDKSHKQPWFKPYNSTTEAERRPYVLPVRADTPGATPHPLSVDEHNKNTTDHATITADRIQLPPPRMTSDPRQNLVRRVPILGGGGHIAVDLIQAVPKDQLQHYTVEPSQSTSPHNFYTGHERSRYESYARMTALLVRVVIVIAGIIAAFSSAGVNVISVVTGLGIVGILYTYGAQPLVTNICSSIYIHGSGRIDMLDYIVIGGAFKGFVGSFNAQFIELIDDLSPFTGGPRRIQQIPTGTFANTPFSVFPNGPPPAVIDEYFKELDKANALRKQQGISGMIEPIREIQLWMDPRYVRQDMLMVR